MSSIWLLTLIFLVMGIAESSVNVGANTLLIWLHGKVVGTFMNGLHFSFSIGAFITPLIIARTLSMTNDIVWAYWILALLILLTVPWFTRHPSPTHEREKHEVHDTVSNYPFVFLLAIFLLLSLFPFQKAGTASTS